MINDDLVGFVKLLKLWVFCILGQFVNDRLYFTTIV